MEGAIQTQDNGLLWTGFRGPLINIAKRKRINGWKNVASVPNRCISRSPARFCVVELPGSEWVLHGAQANLYQNECCSQPWREDKHFQKNMLGTVKSLDSGDLTWTPLLYLCCMWDRASHWNPPVHTGTHTSRIMLEFSDVPFEQETFEVPGFPKGRREPRNPKRIMENLAVSPHSWEKTLLDFPKQVESGISSCVPMGFAWTLLCKKFHLVEVFEPLGVVGSTATWGTYIHTDAEM